MKRLVFLGDMHCGNRFGLTPPTWQYQETDGFYAKVAQFQRELWSWYTKTIDYLKPIEALIDNGDSIDGKGTKSGGTELFEMDRIRQVDIAYECLKYADAKTYRVINGTPYHVGQDEDFEYILASKLNGRYSNHDNFECEGVRFDVKHFVGNSSVPYGRSTAIQKEETWIALKHERDKKANK